MYFLCSFYTKNGLSASKAALSISKNPIIEPFCRKNGLLSMLCSHKPCIRPPFRRIRPCTGNPLKEREIPPHSVMKSRPVHIYQQGRQEVAMDQKETTAPVLYDNAPTIEFTLPPREEAYTDPDPIVTEPEETPSIQRRIHPASVLRRALCILFIGSALLCGGVCIGHAVRLFLPEKDDIPAMLLGLISAGEVHTAPASLYRCTAPAPLPDLPISPVPYSPEPERMADRSHSPLTLINETPYTPDPEKLAQNRTIPALESLQAQYGSGAPVVLILSTHATESYSGHASEGYRTTDDSENVIRTASVIAETLEDAGIGVIHCRTRFDEEDFTLAYYNASLEIRRQLRDHPSIQYILDVHRDSVQDAGGSYLAMESDGLAQMMFVVGTDHGGSGHTGWKDNLGLAARLHNAMEQAHPGVMRPVNLRSASFNQQYTGGSLILEIGSCAGSLENAVKSAELFGQIFAEEIIG